ncbi:hypothetical protein KSS87_010480 [Heliosperma pusillum]|nr:hypothetical protein KSS87_010480 [Heliosperma pusillum]
MAPLSEDDSYDEYLRELNSKGYRLFPARTPEDMRREALRFYNNFNDVDDKSDPSTWLARKMACTISPSVVTLSRCRDEDKIKLYSSGIIVQYKDIKKIMSSTYITGGCLELGLKVNVLLPSGTEVVGEVSFEDLHHNVVLISADIHDVSCASLCTEFVDVCADVMSLGRHPKSGLMVSRGQINVRNDDLDSDDLMSSTCTISECGIGGPIILQSSGAVVGMNVYINQKSSSFIPSILLSHYLKHLLTNGEILRPWLGFKARNLNEKSLADLEAVYQKFRSTNGIFVTNVARGSPAHRAGIHVDDIITSCSDILLSSPVELADLLLKLGKASLGVSSRERKRKRKREHRVIKVVIQRPTTCTRFDKIIKFKYFNSPDVNRWPVIPLDISGWNDLLTCDSGATQMMFCRLSLITGPDLGDSQ